MFDQIPFHPVPGKDTRARIQMLALSTCGFCGRGQEFLEEHGIAYEWVHLDTLAPEVKAAAKQEFKDKFGVTLSYPSLVADGERHVVGFVRRFWEEFLGLTPDTSATEAESVD